MIEIPSTLVEAKTFDWEAFYEVLEHLKTSELTEENFEPWMDKVNDAHWVPFTAHIILVWHGRRDITDEDIAAHLEQFYKEIYPALEPRLSSLVEKAINANLSSIEYENDIDKLKKERTEKDLKTVSLETKDASATNSINKAFSRLTVDINNENLGYRTARSKLKSEKDRQLRQIIWTATEKARKVFAETHFEDIKDLIKLRQDLAKSAGFSSYRDFYWADKGRDFSANQTIEFANYAEEVFAELTETTMRNHARELGISEVKPWDVDFKMSDVKGEVYSEEDFEGLALKAFKSMDQEFSIIVETMANRGDIDFIARDGKARDNYASYIYPGNQPLAFTNSTGHLSDVHTILHECGHCIHYSMSHTAGNKYWTFFGKSDLAETIARFIENLGVIALLEAGVLDAQSLAFHRAEQRFTLLNTLRMISNRDKFQHWVYDQSSNNQTSTAFDKFFLENCSNYGVNWSGQEEILARSWNDAINFIYPFRTIEYSMAATAHLLLLREFDRNRSATLETLKGVMRQGGKISLGEAMASFGLPHPLEKTAVDMVSGYLNPKY